MQYFIFSLIIKVILKNDVRTIFKGNPPDAPPSSLMNSIVNPKVKKMKGEGVGAHSLIRSISGVEGRAGASERGLKRLTSNSIIHTDLHKPNNKLINA